MFKQYRLFVASTASAVLGLCALAFYWLDPAVFRCLTREDGPVETATAALYVVAAGVLASAALRRRTRRFGAWAYATLFFLVAGEELSWGQRIFGFATPAAVVDINLQKEFTVHNINGVMQHIRMLGLSVVGTICFAVPVLFQRIPWFRSMCLRLGMPVFPLWAAGAVVVGFLFMACPRLFHTWGIQALDETGELFVGAAMALFALSVRERQDRPSLCWRKDDFNEPVPARNRCRAYRC